MNLYEINIYIYKDKKCRLKHVIYARILTTAQEIIDIFNTETFVHWVPKRIGFVKKTYTKIPPYELELAQLDCAEKQLEYRRKHKRKEETV